MEQQGLSAVGGPNFPPPEDSLVPAAVAVSPGGPTHVLVSDEIAEHIAGCNMAFNREVLLGLGGFDPLYRAAGDDVDICWRFQNARYTIGFAPAAVVWHFRRNTISAYLTSRRAMARRRRWSTASIRCALTSSAGEMAGADLWRSLRRPAAVAQAGDLFRGLRPRPLSDDVRAALLARRLPAAHFRVERGGAGAGGGRPHRRRLGGASHRAPAGHLDLCISAPLKAPIDKRFRSLKARALIALLIYLGPILRGWTRVKWRVKEINAVDPIGAGAVDQPAKISWRERALFLSYWGQNSEEKEVLLGGLMDFLVPRKYFLQVDEGWGDWDLKIARGLWSRAFVLVCAENHGGEKRVLRVRCAMRLSRLSTFVLRIYASAIAIALVAGQPAVAGFVAVCGVANGLYIARETLRFGSIMHRVIEQVARQGGLIAMHRPGGSAKAD